MAARRLDKERAEARRLVEAEGLSLAAAAERVGVSGTTVRAWQKADEEAGNGWAFSGSPSAEAKARADAKTAEERRAGTARARRATGNRWADWRGAEADYWGTLTGGIRQTAVEAITAARTAIAVRDADTTLKWARALRDFAVTGGIFADKADKMSDIGSAPSMTVLGSDDAYEGELATVLSWADEIAKARERRTAG